jgi:hypothetical protein
MKNSSQDSNAKITGWHTVSLKHKGKSEKVAVELPANSDSDHEEEAVQFVQTLEDNQQIEHKPGPLTAGKTHQIETDRQGNKRLVRKRFSAI